MRLELNLILKVCKIKGSERLSSVTRSSTTSGVPKTGRTLLFGSWNSLCDPNMLPQGQSRLEQIQ
jgi:hypothetical protein